MNTLPPSRSRTAKDDARERHERELMEEIRRENQNPFQTIGDAVTSRWSYVYNHYLYTSGVLLVAFCCWSVYPSLVRFRHSHIMRYHRNQLVFRRWFFASNHMPKWDKKFLQEVIVPPLQSTPKVTVETVLKAERAAAHDATAAAFPATTAVPCDQVSVETTPSSALSAAEKDFKFSRTQNLLDVTSLQTTSNAKSSFAKGESRDSEREFNRALQRINSVYFNSGRHQFTEDFQACHDPQQLRTDITAAVKHARSTVVMIETHDTVKSVPPGYEVWWLSADEARRTRFCKFWIGGLLFARLLQDLLDMPEMPDFVQ